MDKKYVGDRDLSSALDVVVRGRVVPDTAVAAAIGRHDAGTLALGRLTQRVRALFENGGLRGLWAAMLGIASALCHVDRKPSALPELLRLLTAYAHEVPDPSVPQPLREFAQGCGTSRSHVEARTLVATLDLLATRARLVTSGSGPA